MNATTESTAFLLQRLLTVSNQVGLSPQSCWQVEFGRNGTTALRAHRPGSVKLNGLFDVFPESYWAHFTTLRCVTLRCRAQGTVTIRLLRRYSDGSGETCLKEWRSSGSKSEADIALTVELVDPAAPESYLMLEATSSAAGVTLEGMVWETDQIPTNRPCVGVAITTYNRESFLIANLARLHGRLAGGRIIVVNHGVPGLEKRLADQFPTDLEIRCIDQENKGGAGGFTRGMIEHHATSDISHVLLMDDDIDLPEDLVERLTAILSFADPNICLGGAMFDYHRRSQLFSAGDILLPNGFGLGHIAPPDGCDISLPSGVDFLTRIHRPDFNGWWCFAFPVTALDEVGLPMPCFIRGDDVEFGYRLMRAGKPTLGWPGLAVWHLPFADKAAPWHMFYDRRNSLFTNARHRRIGRWTAFRKLHGGFAHHLLRYDYERVQAMTLGIAAFNKGAQAMAEWNCHDHATLIAATSSATMNNQAMPTAQHLPSRRLTGISRSLRMAARFVYDLSCPWRDRTPVSLSPGEIWRPDFHHRPAVAVELAKDGQPVRSFRYDWRKSWEAVIRYLPAIIRMLLRFYQEVPFYSINLYNSSQKPQ